MKTLLALPILAILLAATPAFAAGPNASDGQATSSNWSGYAAADSTYTGVGGTWIVPSSTSATTDISADATWVGIGGVNSQNLIQTGTQTVVENGSTSYQAWYEMLPDVEQIIPITVQAGDSITASLDETNQSQNQWQLSFTDNTTHQNYTTTLTYDSDGSSADWIEERPISGNSYLPLDNFGTASFTNAYAIVNGVNESLVSAGAQPITMITQDNQSLAIPSAIGSDGESFSVTRTDISSTMQQQETTQNVQGGRGWRHNGNGYQVQTYVIGQQGQGNGMQVQSFGIGPNASTTQQIVTQVGNGTLTVTFGDTGASYSFSF